MDVEELLSFRKEYEESGLNISNFAQKKGMEYWKTRYALRKALSCEKKKADVKFTPLRVKHSEEKQGELRILTSYGAQIIVFL